MYIILLYYYYTAILFFLNPSPNKMGWNYFLHFSLHAGVSIMMFCYTMEFNARKVCPKEENLVNTFVPRFYECFVKWIVCVGKNECCKGSHHRPNFEVSSYNYWPACCQHCKLARNSLCELMMTADWEEPARTTASLVEAAGHLLQCVLSRHWRTSTSHYPFSLTKDEFNVLSCIGGEKIYPPQYVCRARCDVQWHWTLLLPFYLILSNQRTMLLTLCITIEG